MKSPTETDRLRSSGIAPGIFAVLLVLLALLAAPAGAMAVEIEGTSSTYLLSRETADNSQLLPIYEYLNFSVRDTGTDSISFAFGGWVRYDLGDHVGDRKKDSDLQYAFLSYRHKESNAVVNLGRIMVFEGVAAERLDGVYARTDLMGGFGISAFGGTPVMTNDEDDSGTDSIYGGRISQQKDGLYTIGLSYLWQEKDSYDFREEEGVDLWFKPFGMIEVMGKSAYNAYADGWMQHTYTVVLGPFAKLKLNAEVSRINYEYYFDATTTSAFTFAPGGAVDPKEKLDLVGLTASYPIGEATSLSVDMKQYGYAIAGNAKYYGAGIRFSKPKDLAVGASAHRMDGETDRLRYDEYRIYCMKKFGHFDATVSLFDVEYDAEINGVKRAYAASVAAGYELTEKLMLGADVEYAENPDYDKDVRGFLKLIYKFQASLGKGGA